MRELEAEIKLLEEIARNLAAGDLSARVCLPSLESRDDDIGRLGRSVNRLAETLQANLSRLERRLRQLWKLSESERNLATLLEVRPLLEQLPQAAVDILGADSAFLYIAQQADLAETALAWPKEIDKPLMEWLQAQTLEVSKDGIPRRFRNDNARGMAVPLEVRQTEADSERPWQTIGALGVARTDAEKPFDMDDQMLLFALAGSAGLAIERSRVVAESEQSHLRSLMEGMNEGVILVELSSARAIVVNAAARRLLGWPLGNDLVLSPENPVDAKLLELVRKVHTDSASSGAEELTLGGHVVSARATVARDRNGELIGSIVTLVDMTLEKQVERLREDLSAMIVHDLRTPLTMIIGSLETLAGSTDAKDAFQQELVDIGLAGGKSLLELVNTLLDISKLESGEMPLERTHVKVGELIQSAVSQVKQIARQNQVELEVDVPPGTGTAWVDQEKIERVLINLLGNSLKFTPAGGTVTISVCDDSARGWMLIGIEDTGEGIPSEYHERIFDKFEQVASRKAGKKMSTGLGLTFCKLAVEAHGGRIWVESPIFPQTAPDSPRGSRFSFTLPVKPLC